jgi:hypothetical protein
VSEIAVTHGTRQQSLHWADTAAVLYLIAPLFVFFACFVRLEIAISACAIIIFMAYELVRQTSWRERCGAGWESLYFFCLAALWMWLAGGVGPIPLVQNDDWGKHNLIITLLAEHSWPPTIELPHFGSMALRYYIGWHLIPSLILKLTNIQAIGLVTWGWSTLGIFLFFSLLRRLVGQHGAIIAAPLAFIFFGGADYIGTQITGNELLGVLYHFELWNGWIEFPSNTTVLFWAPTQALPAWLAVALLMRCRKRNRLLPYCALVLSSTMLWSPFATIGLLPFLLALALYHGLKPLVFSWRTITSSLLLGGPIVLYLASGSAAVLHGFIWETKCTFAPCFTWASYPLFLVVEIGAPLVVLFLRKKPEGGFLVAAAGALCIIPLYRIGLMNDFAMRASLPSLAVLAILCARLFSERRPYPLAALAVLILAFPSVLGEMTRGFLREHPYVIDLAEFDEPYRWWIDQSFTPGPIWVLRRSVISDKAAKRAP